MTAPITFQPADSEPYVISAPSDVTFGFGTPLADGTPTLNIVYDLKQTTDGTETLTFQAPPAPEEQLFGLRTSVTVTVKNDTGHDIDGFTLEARNAQYQYDAKGNIVLDFSQYHPENYAHVHGLTATTFGGETLSLLAPDGTVPGTGDYPAASQVKATGVIHNGASITSTPFTLHNEQVAQPDDPTKTQNNTFYFQATPGILDDTIAATIGSEPPALHFLSATAPAPDLALTLPTDLASASLGASGVDTVPVVPEPPPAAWGDPLTASAAMAAWVTPDSQPMLLTHA